MKALSRYVRLESRPGISLVVFKTGADAASKLVTLVITVAAARALAPEDFGVYALAVTTGWILGVASDAGLPMFLATRLARLAPIEGRRRSAFDDVMGWRLRFAAWAVAGGAAAGVALVPPQVRPAFALIVCYQVMAAVIETIAHAYRGLGRTDVESAVTLAYRGALCVCVLAALAVHPSLLSLSLALLVPTLAAFERAGRIARRLMAVDGDARAPGGTLTRQRFISHVTPLGLGVLLSAIYFRCDVYFLEHLHGIESVGFYNAAFRIVEALRLFPAAALAVAYPMLCGASNAGVLRRLAAVLAGLGAVAAAMLALSAEALLARLYGPAFGTAAAALHVLALSLPLLFVNYALTHQVIAWERHRAYLTVATAALAANVAGNAWLIPDGGMVGAAWSTFLTEVVVCAGCLAVLRRR